MQSKFQSIIADYLDDMASEAAAFTAFVRQAASARATRLSRLTVLERELDKMDGDFLPPTDVEYKAGEPEDRLRRIVRDLERSLSPVARREEAVPGAPQIEAEAAGDASIVVSRMQHVQLPRT